MFRSLCEWIYTYLKENEALRACVESTVLLTLSAYRTLVTYSAHQDQDQTHVPLPLPVARLLGPEAQSSAGETSPLFEEKT